MQPFVDQFSYNAWATARLIEPMRGLPADSRESPVEGIYGSIPQTFRHLLVVEDGYLELLGVRPRLLPPNADFDQCAALAPSVEQAYIDFAASLAADALVRPVSIPWFEHPVAVGDALSQVFTHSVEHRADIASALTRLGIAPPPIDYVLWAFERDGHPIRAS